MWNLLITSESIHDEIYFDDVFGLESKELVDDS